ncbi:MAG: hypothetical protein CL521_01860 [Actinobacteria bacterium]|nr:hypothetical protein [Actinomycetota bacterium]
MSQKKWILISIFLTWISSNTHAVPTLTGSSGLIKVPTAEALQYKQFNIGIDSQVTDTGEMLTYSYKLGLGTFKNLEMSLIGGSTPKEGVFINAKYYLMSDTARLPLSIAIGAENLSSMSQTNIYMVASKKIRYDIGLHGGFKATINEEINPTIMGGINYLLLQQLELLADIDGNETAYAINTGVRFYLTPDIAFKASILDVFNTSPNEIQINAGVAISRYL